LIPKGPAMEVVVVTEVVVMELIVMEVVVMEIVAMEVVVIIRMLDVFGLNFGLLRGYFDHLKM
jgi:hypothetical protein